jgi:hypothetical protein
MSELSFRQHVTLTIIDKLVIAALLLAICAWANEHLEFVKTRDQGKIERDKAEREVRFENQKALLDLVQRQLNELYYPIYFRLAKDDAIWDTIMSNQQAGTSAEQNFVIPNNKSVLALLEAHTNLLFRPDEAREPALISAFLQYERHMDVYLSLRDAGDKRRPADLGVDYPANICHLVEARVSELESEITSIQLASKGVNGSNVMPAKSTECARARRAIQRAP